MVRDEHVEEEILNEIGEMLGRVIAIEDFDLLLESLVLKIGLKRAGVEASGFVGFQHVMQGADREGGMILVDDELLQGAWDVPF